MKLLNLYNSLDDIPAFNFLKFLEEPDMKYLFSIAKEEYSKEEISESLDAWDNIFQQYMDFVGLGERTLKIMKQEDKILRLKIQMYSQDKKHLLAVIKKEEYILNELKKGISTKDTMYEEVALISKHMGFPIKIKEISAKEYFAYAKNMKHG